MINDSGKKADCHETRWWFHDTSDPLIRYVRDRRLQIACECLLAASKTSPKDWGKILVVCGGVGGEGSFLIRKGFPAPWVSDYDQKLLKTMGQRDALLKGLACDASRLPFQENSFDLVLVQDGIHHLKNPVLGLVEMLRVAKRAVIMIEPHEGWVAKIWGTKVEKDTSTGDKNFVFRWNAWLFRQVVSSYLVNHNFDISFLRLWDHSTAALRIFSWVPQQAARLKMIQAFYSILRRIFFWLGNMSIGIVLFKKGEPR